MTDHIGTERMHEIVDGAALSTEPGGELEHLDACDGCRDQLEALSGVVTELRDLPKEAVAPEGLWTEIQARLGERGHATASSDVVALNPRARRRFALSVAQLAAAAVVVSVVSAGMMWAALRGTVDAMPQVAEVPVESALSHASRVALGGEDGYAAALSELEVLVEQGRDMLAPETVAALDESLRTIDEALLAVRAAMQDDPASDLLARMLVNHQRSKLRVLRQAAVSVQIQS